MNGAVPTPGALDQGQPTRAVTEALGRLEDLPDRPVSEQVEVYDGVHRALQDALATLDEV